jgi:hypothetical protein
VARPRDCAPVALSAGPMAMRCTPRRVASGSEGTSLMPKEASSKHGVSAGRLTELILQRRKGGGDARHERRGLDKLSRSACILPCCPSSDRRDLERASLQQVCH